jgi:hypothetical protein
MNMPGFVSLEAAERRLSAADNAVPIPHWPSPDMTYLGTGRRAAPEFPADLLGSFWTAWTKQSAAGASAPVDYVGAALLACVGGSAGKCPLAYSRRGMDGTAGYLDCKCRLSVDREIPRNGRGIRSSPSCRRFDGCGL